MRVETRALAPSPASLQALGHALPRPQFPRRLGELPWKRPTERFCREGIDGRLEVKLGDRLIDELVRHPLPLNARELNALLLQAVDASEGDELRLPAGAAKTSVPPAPAPASPGAKGEKLQFAPLQPFRGRRSEAPRNAPALVRGHLDLASRSSRTLRTARVFAARFSSSFVDFLDLSLGLLDCCAVGVRPRRNEQVLVVSALLLTALLLTLDLNAGPLVIGATLAFLPQPLLPLLLFFLLLLKKVCG